MNVDAMEQKSTENLQKQVTKRENVNNLRRCINRITKLARVEKQRRYVSRVVIK